MSKRFLFVIRCVSHKELTKKFYCSIEKDPLDTTAKQRESQDCSSKVRSGIIIFY